MRKGVNNLDKCQEIANNGKIYMKNYLEEIYRLRETVAGLRGELKNEIKIANRATEYVFEIAKQQNSEYFRFT